MAPAWANNPHQQQHQQYQQQQQQQPQQGGYQQYGQQSQQGGYQQQQGAYQQQPYGAYGQPMPVQPTSGQPGAQGQQHGMQSMVPGAPSPGQPPAPPQDPLEQLREPPNTFPLSSLADDQKNQLMANTEALNDWLLALPDVHELGEKLEKLRTDGKEKAEKILEHESEFGLLEGLCNEVCENLTSKALRVQDLEQRKNAILAQATPLQMQTKLGVMMQEAEDAGENAMNEALAGPMLDKGGLAALRESYMSNKRAKHSRAALMHAMVV